MDRFTAYRKDGTAIIENTSLRQALLAGRREQWVDVRRTDRPVADPKRREELRASLWGLSRFGEDLFVIGITEQEET